MIAGDFNAINPAWQSHGFGRNGDDEVARWASNAGLFLTTEVDVGTHNLGNTLDLTFTNIHGAQSEIAPHLETGSDHRTILITLPSYRTDGGYRRPPKPEPEFSRNLAALIPAHWNTTDPRDPMEIEERFETLVKMIQEARPLRPTSGAPKSQWWDEEVKEAGRAYRLSRSANHRKEWHKLIRKKKAGYWESLIAGANTANKAYKLARWAKRSSQFGSPPLEGPDGPITSPKKKADYFLQLLLEKAPKEPERDEEGPPQRAIRMDPVLEDWEIEDALLRAGNTAPGDDEITTQVLMRAWPYISTTIARLYKASI